MAVNVNDPAALLASANCYACYASDNGQMQLLKLALLQQILIALNPTADTSPATLLKQANCYSCFGSGAGTMRLIELALLQQIAQVAL